KLRTRPPGITLGPSGVLCTLQHECESYFLAAAPAETIRTGRVFSQGAGMNVSRKFTNGLLGFVVLLLVSAGACFAQSTATLAGTVTDPTGAVVPGANIKVRSLATNTIRETV